jgi:hypothetical protein
MTSDSYITNDLHRITGLLHQSLPPSTDSAFTSSSSFSSLKEIKDPKLHHMSALADAVCINWQNEGNYELKWAPHHAGL